MKCALLLLAFASCGGKAQPHAAHHADITVPPPAERHYQLAEHISRNQALREWPTIEQTLADLAKPPARTTANAGYLDELAHLHAEKQPFPLALTAADCVTLPGADAYNVVDQICGYVPMKAVEPADAVQAWSEGDPDQMLAHCDVTSDGDLRGPPRACDQIAILTTPPLVRVRVWKRDRHILQPPAAPAPDLSLTIANDALDLTKLREKTIVALAAAPLALHGTAGAAFAGPRASDLFPGTLEHAQLDFTLTKAPTGVELTATLTLYLSSAESPGTFRLATADERRTFMNAVSAALTTSLEPYCLSSWDERGDGTHLIWRC